MAARKAATKPARKTPTKTASPAQPVATMPGRNGGTLRVGNPGNRGGGRLPGWLEDFCDELLADPACREQVQAIMRDKDHAAFATMWRTAAERAHGKPRQPVEQVGTARQEVTVRFVREDQR